MLNSAELFVSMDLLDATSTSDVDERDLLESATSEYWERVLLTANGHLNSSLNLRPPGTSSDLNVNDMEGVTADSVVRVVDQNRSMTRGCVRLRCTKGLPPSQDLSLLCTPHHPLQRHMFLSA